MPLDDRFLAPHALARWASRQPAAPALRHVDGSVVSYGELYADSLRWAAGLRGCGVAKGTQVATLLPNVFDAHRTLLGIAWLSAVEVPLNTAAVGRLLAYMLNLSEATLLVTTSAFTEVIAAVAPELEHLRTVVVVDSDEPGPLCGLRSVGRASLLAPPPAQPGELDGPRYRDTAALLFTSGTTGPSKAVITPWAVVYHNWSWVPEDTLAAGEGLYCAFPLFHNSGRAAFNYALVRGGHLVIRDKFSATRFWDDVRATGASTAALVGPLTALLFSVDPAPDDADNPLRSVIVGPMIPEMEAFERRFGVRVATCYGQTETGAAVATGWDHGPWSGCGRLRRDYPWPEVRVVDAHDEPLGPGEVGELVVRCAEPWALNAGYYKMPDKTADAWRNGWFHTGDAFRYDEDGWYYFVDRLRDVIRRRGENISSFEVEVSVAEHPDVIECAAIGTPGDFGDEEVLVAVIVREPDRFDPAELIGFLSSRLPAYMIPRYVEVMDDFPRNQTSMRVLKHELRSRGRGGSTWDRHSAGNGPASSTGQRRGGR